MSRVRAKICGLREPAHAAAAIEAGADFIGVNFVEGARRRITVEQAKAIVAVLPPRPQPPATVLPLAHEGLWFQSCAEALDARLAERRPLVVGLFADQPVSLVNAIAEAAGLDLIQLCGDEPWEIALQLKRPTIKMLRPTPGTSADDVRAAIEPGTASLCLLDAHVPGQLGGTGARADWYLAADLARSIPLMLAGGLTPENVTEAIATVRPWAVDVSSGVERDGGKDPELIRAFLQAVRVENHNGTEGHGWHKEVMGGGR